jgi:hypothetical protein
MPDGTTTTGRAVGVDGTTGALLIEDAAGREVELLVGEVTHVRLATGLGVYADTHGEQAAGRDSGGRGVTL